jgi:hypothetical protein
VRNRKQIEEQRYRHKKRDRERNTHKEREREGQGDRDIETLGGTKSVTERQKERQERIRESGIDRQNRQTNRQR